MEVSFIGLEQPTESPDSLRPPPEPKHQRDAGLVLFREGGSQIDIVKVRDDRGRQRKILRYVIFKRYPDGNIPARVTSIDSPQ